MSDHAERAQSRRVTWLVQRARRTLRTAWLAFEDGDYASAINRAYYSIFYAANAALSTRNLERHKHTGVISEFRLQFIKTRLLEREYSAFFGDVMDARHSSDYDFMVDVERERAKSAVDEAERFVTRIEQFLQEQAHGASANLANGE